MTGLTTDIGVKQSHGIGRTAFGFHRSREIFGDAFLWIADAGHSRDFFAAAQHGLRCGAAAKGSDIRRQLKFTAPAIQRVMIAMHDVNGDVALGQTFHLATKRHKSAQAAIFRIVKIAGDGEEVRFGVNGVRDQALQGADRRRLQVVP
jgi:hypothetical protein